MPLILEITHKDIQSLASDQLTDLLRRLLILEALRFKLPVSSIHVPMDISVKDAGEDGRAQWQNGPARTDFLPNRLTIFQCKATKMPPQKCKAEMQMKGTKKLKARINDTLDAGGAYVLFCTQNLNEDQIAARITQIRGAIREAGKAYWREATIEIYDAAKIGNWANCHLTATLAVSEYAGRTLIPGIMTWDYWSRSRESRHFEFVASEESKRYIAQLRNHLAASRKTARITGLSGLGKTRLALEAFRPVQSDDLTNDLSRQVAYVPDAEEFPNLAAEVNQWCMQGLGGILVVDNCSDDLHHKLKTAVEHEESQLTGCRKIRCLHEITS